MITVIKDNWAILSTCFLGIVWVITRSEKVKNLDMRVSVLEDDDTIDRIACKEIRATCRAHFTSEISHSASTLAHLASQFDGAEKRSEERFQLMMAQILKITENKQDR